MSTPMTTAAARWWPRPRAHRRRTAERVPVDAHPEHLDAHPEHLEPAACFSAMLLQRDKKALRPLNSGVGVRRPTPASLPRLQIPQTWTPAMPYVSSRSTSEATACTLVASEIPKTPSSGSSAQSSARGYATLLSPIAVERGGDQPVQGRPSNIPRFKASCRSGGPSANYAKSSSGRQENQRHRPLVFSMEPTPVSSRSSSFNTNTGTRKDAARSSVNIGKNPVSASKKDAIPVTPKNPRSQKFVSKIPKPRANHALPSGRRAMRLSSGNNLFLQVNWNVQPKGSTTRSTSGTGTTRLNEHDQELSDLKTRLCLELHIASTQLRSRLLRIYDTKALPELLFRRMKITELSERLRALQSTIEHDKRTGTSSQLEVEFLEGSAYSLLQELHQEQSVQSKPQASWACDFAAILEQREKLEEREKAGGTEIDRALDYPELLNPHMVGIEVRKQSFDGLEPYMVEMWAMRHNLPRSRLQDVKGTGIIECYLTAVLSEPLEPLPASLLQNRRFGYCCLHHYSQWKPAVSHYALAQKLTNLLIVFHDLWSIFPNSMTTDEKAVFEGLGDKLYSFASQFQRFANKGHPDWDGAECYYCFATMPTRIYDAGGDSLWSYLLPFALVAGFGAYHGILMAMLTGGRKPEYVNRLLGREYYLRLRAMMAARKLVNRVVLHCYPDARRG